MEVLNKYFKPISLGLQAVTLLLLFSLKLNNCRIQNDLNTTKKTAKELQKNTVTKEDLQQASDSILIKEKMLDKQR